MPHWLLIDIRITPWIYVTDVRDGPTLICTSNTPLLTPQFIMMEKSMHV